MKILRIKVNNSPIYNTPVDISFYAGQRVEQSHLDAVFNLFGNIYINTTEAFIGINASGKTTALKVISFVISLLRADSLNAASVSKVVGFDNNVIFDIDFFADNKICHLTSEIIKRKEDDGSFAIHILSEKLWMKNITSKINKTNMFDYSGMKPDRERETSSEYLPDDISIMIAVNKQTKDIITGVNLVGLTNFNLLIPIKNITVATEIISLLDPTIESISIGKTNNRFSARLKFYGQKEMLLYDPRELNVYLSSGTVKGIGVFSEALRVLKTGGYLLVDEIENHFNREIVSSLLRLFMNKKTNSKGAVLIFSTHYPALLDDIPRNDAIFITRNIKGLSVDNLRTLLDRNDMKKSEVYQSNFLGGTAPKYQAMADLQKRIIKNMEA